MAMAAWAATRRVSGEYTGQILVKHWSNSNPRVSGECVSAVCESSAMAVRAHTRSDARARTHTLVAVWWAAALSPDQTPRAEALEDPAASDITDTAPLKFQHRYLIHTRFTPASCVAYHAAVAASANLHVIYT
jgi:hypothetical protein